MWHLVCNYYPKWTNILICFDLLKNGNFLVLFKRFMVRLIWCYNNITINIIIKHLHRHHIVKSRIRSFLLCIFSDVFVVCFHPCLVSWRDLSPTLQGPYSTILLICKGWNVLLSATQCRRGKNSSNRI